MGSIVRFARPRPMIRLPQKAEAERESREAERSLFILIGSFFATALLMCAVVVAMVSKTWTDLIMISAFVFVFALVKIALANALIYVMVRYDKEHASAAAYDRAVRARLSPRYGLRLKYRRTADGRAAPAGAQVISVGKRQAASKLPSKSESAPG
jgi:hypothetical protein